MKAIALALAIAALTASAASAVAAGNVLGARSIKVCAAAGDFWPTMTLALDGSTAWIACKEQARVVRVDTRTGKTLASVRLGDLTIAVASGFHSIWALGSSGTLYRLSPSGKVVRQIPLNLAAAYNIWIGGGSVWVADDQGAKVVRVSPKTNRVVASVAAGNGPADMAFAGTTAWVVNHRDLVLTRIDLRTNRSAPLTTLGTEGQAAPERMVRARGKLWITGRGVDLLKVNPADGKIEATIEIGASGIDLAVDRDALIVPTRSAETDVRGFPTMNAVRRISISSGAVTTLAGTVGRVDVHGLVAQKGVVWLADNTGGRLYRLASAR
jgi:DNA-binding beta-propeller fold protein YncE